MSQPATSQALTRLRLVLRDPIFERAMGGVRPTARADRLTRRVDRPLRTAVARRPPHHPLRQIGLAGTGRLNQLHDVAVRSPTDTLRILQMLHLEHQVRLVTSTFLAPPAIVRSTDLGF